MSSSHQDEYHRRHHHRIRRRHEDHWAHDDRVNESYDSPYNRNHYQHDEERELDWTTKQSLPSPMVDPVSAYSHREDRKQSSHRRTHTTREPGAVHDVHLNTEEFNAHHTNSRIASHEEPETDTLQRSRSRGRTALAASGSLVGIRNRQQSQRDTRINSRRDKRLNEEDKEQDKEQDLKKHHSARRALRKDSKSSSSNNNNNGKQDSVEVLNSEAGKQRPHSPAPSLHRRRQSERLTDEEKEKRRTQTNKPSIARHGSSTVTSPQPSSGSSGRASRKRQHDRRNDASCDDTAEYRREPKRLRKEDDEPKRLRIEDDEPLPSPNHSVKRSLPCRRSHSLTGTHATSEKVRRSLDLSTLKTSEERTTTARPHDGRDDEKRRPSRLTTTSSVVSQREEERKKSRTPVGERSIGPKEKHQGQDASNRPFSPSSELKENRRIVREEDKANHSKGHVVSSSSHEERENGRESKRQKREDHHPSVTLGQQEQQRHSSSYRRPEPSQDSPKQRSRESQESRTDPLKKPRRLTLEEKKLQRLEKVKKLMELKRSHGTISPEHSSSDAQLLPPDAVPVSGTTATPKTETTTPSSTQPQQPVTPSKHSPLTLRLSTTAEKRVLTTRRLGMAPAAFMDESLDGEPTTLITDSSLLPRSSHGVGGKDSSKDNRRENPTEEGHSSSSAGLDSLDAFMSDIAVAVDALVQADRNKMDKKLKRKKKGQVTSISLDGILSLQQHQKFRIKSQVESDDVGRNSSGVRKTGNGRMVEESRHSVALPALGDIKTDGKDETVSSSGISDLLPDTGTTAPRHVSVREDTFVAIPSKLPVVTAGSSSTSLPVLFDSSETLVERSTGAKDSLCLHQADEKEKDEEKKEEEAVEGVSTTPTTSKVPASERIESVLELSSTTPTASDEDEDDRYYQQFVAEIKKRQQQETEKEAKAQKEAEEKAAALTAQQKSADEKVEEIDSSEITPTPGALDVEDPEDGKGDLLEEEEDYRFTLLPSGDDGKQSCYFDLIEKVGNKKELPPVDHSKIEYLPFKKNLYVQVREITLMKDHEVDALRKLHGGIRVRGKMCPRPIVTFYQCGLPDVILRVIEKREYSEPFPIQMQALPTLMAGRDCIGIAETGSGKTLAYLFPLLRHVLDQPPLRNGDGPIGLILAPTRELAVQIQKETNRFAKILHLRSVAVYGGTGIGEQLSALKRGAEIVVGTPGRLIDVLTINNGRITNLRRVTFVILDEADRMFDLGFEPQVTGILKNVRPDCQTAMFSATFPPHIEALAKKILKKPIEITVGERGQTAQRIEQYVEVWAGLKEKFLRLLQLLGEWSDHGSIIIFVAKQVEADELFTELIKVGYPALVLHGGQDQTDRDFTVLDFKEGKSNILIATSVAARGLDVKSVVLVINYVAPDHLEDYVHRIGRTGRAGTIGVSYTFITPEEGEKADDLIKALKQSGKDVPQPLQRLADTFRVQCNLGLQQKRRGKGFGGKGYKFTASEKSRQQQDRQKMKKDLGMEDEEEEELSSSLMDLDDLDNPMAPIPPPPSSSPTSGIAIQSQQPLVGGPGHSFSAAGPQALAVSTSTDVSDASARAKALVQFAVRSAGVTAPSGTTAGASSDVPRTPDERVRLLEAMMASVRQRVATAVGGGATVGASSNLAAAVSGLSASGYIDPATGNYVDEFEINDYPQDARQRITNKGVLNRISETTGAVLQVKGRFVSNEEKDSIVLMGVKRLYVEIIGRTQIVVQLAKHEIRSLTEQVAKKQLNLPTKPTVGKYSVV